MLTDSIGRLAHPVSYWCLFLLLIFAVPTLGIPQIADEQLWASATIQKVLTPRVDLEYEQQIRLRDNYSTLHKSISELSLSYIILPKWKVTGAYRYERYPDEVGHRITLRARFKDKKKKVGYSYRLQFQSERVGGGELEKHLRNRITLRYSILSWLAPYIQGELFHLTSQEGMELKKYRQTIGFRLFITNAQLIKFFYREQKKVNVKNPDIFYIIGIGYELGI